MSVQVRGDEQKGVEGSTHLSLPEGWRSEPQSARFAFTRAGEAKMFSFVVTPAALTQKRLYADGCGGDEGWEDE